MSLRGLRFALLALVAGLGAPAVAPAWTYAEHWQITYDAYTNVCRDRRGEVVQSDDGAAQIASLCDEKIRACFGHMVALAADMVAAPAQISGTDDDSRYLHNGATRVDCRHFDKIEGPVDAPTQGKDFAPLVSWNLPSRWQFLSLLATNQAHFQPSSRNQWQDPLKSLASDGEARQRGVQAAMAQAAFSLHFLEDAFPSGHIGVNRKLIRQDYDNGYHDDFNYSGRFVSSSADLTNKSAPIWYTYGDSHLDDPVPVVALAKLASLTAAEIGPRLDLIASEVYVKDTLELIPVSQAQAVLTAAEAAAHEPEQPLSARATTERALILSLPKEAKGLRLCVVTNNCETRQIILIPGNALPPEIQGCTDAKETKSKTSYWVCRNGARDQVRKAAEQAILALLNHLVNDTSTLQAELDKADALVPKSYLTLRVSNHGTGVNGQVSILEQTPWLDTTEFCPQPSSDWGLGLSAESIDGKWNNRAALSTALQLFSDNESEPGKPCYNEKRMVAARVQLQLIDTDAHFFNGLDVGFVVDAWRPGGIFEHAVGVSPVVMFGLDRVWEGPDERNYYGGYGVSLDLHAGKRGLYLEIDQLYHKNHRNGTERSLRVLFNARVTSIDTARKY